MSRVIRGQTKVNKNDDWKRKGRSAGPCVVAAWGALILGERIANISERKKRARLVEVIKL